MLKIYFTAIHQTPTLALVQAKLHALPQTIRATITAYTNPFEQVLQLSSKLLLQKLMEYFETTRLVGLEEITLSKTGQPHFNKALYFSNTRSGNMAASVASAVAPVGIDVEKITNIDLVNYQEYFTLTEWEYITYSPNQTETFFTLWTRKEAVVKAAGVGLYANLASFDVLNNPCIFNNTAYYITNIPLMSGYVCHIAATLESPMIELTELTVF
jgi:4'-phosphopantetheinyl transferase